MNTVVTTVVLGTVDQVKGLTFDLVWILVPARNRFPHRDAVAWEECCKCWVAVTRARNLVRVLVGNGVSVPYLPQPVSQETPAARPLRLISTELPRHSPRIAATNPAFRSLTRAYGKRVRETAGSSRAYVLDSGPNPRPGPREQRCPRAYTATR